MSDAQRFNLLEHVQQLLLAHGGTVPAPVHQLQQVQDQVLQEDQEVQLDVVNEVPENAHIVNIDDILKEFDINEHYV